MKLNIIIIGMLILLFSSVCFVCGEASVPAYIHIVSVTDSGTSPNYVEVKGNITMDKEGTVLFNRDGQPYGLGLYYIGKLFSIGEKDGTFNNDHGMGIFSFTIPGHFINDFKSILISFSDGGNRFTPISDTWHFTNVNAILDLDGIPDSFTIGENLYGVVRLTDSVTGVPVHDVKLHFSTGDGWIDEYAVTDANGQVNLSDLKLYSFEVGEHTLNVDYESFDGTIVNSSSKIISIKQDTSIDLDKVPTPFMTDDLLSGLINLTSSSGVGVPDAEIEILVDGVSVANKTTDSNGEFKLFWMNHVFNAAGEYNLTVKYQGNGTYNPISNSKIIKVDKRDINIGLDKVTTPLMVGDSLTGLIDLTSSGVGVPGAGLEILVDGVSVCNTTTYFNGKFDLFWMGHVFNTVGEYNLTVKYQGDETYKPTSNSKIIIVNKRYTSIGLNKVPTPFMTGDLLTLVN
ncbi:MAG: hypothetical protein LBC39_00835 [Methanobrevibacter sp.]|jgi:hypothetical protein|nr:hypothetical protein [Candidatus Methanovirga aequatorialis]